MSSTAYLAAGNIASRTSGTEAITSRLQADYGKSTDSFQKAVLAEAMGNHGSGDYLPQLLEGAASESFDLRSAAASGMRNLPDDSVKDTLLAAAESEENPIVSENILNALGYRSLHKSDFDRLITRFAKDDSLENQKKLAEILMSADADHHADASEALKRFAAESQEEDIRATIRTHFACPQPNQYGDGCRE